MAEKLKLIAIGERDNVTRWISMESICRVSVSSKYLTIITNYPDRNTYPLDKVPKNIMAILPHDIVKAIKDRQK